MVLEVKANQKCNEAQEASRYWKQLSELEHQVRIWFQKQENSLEMQQVTWAGPLDDLLHGNSKAEHVGEE